MHCLTGCYLGETDEEESKIQEPKDRKQQDRNYFQLKINIPPNGSKQLYFKSEGEKQGWKEQLQKVMGYSNVLDFYEFEKTLGKGQFGLVKMARHLKTGIKVAIKQVKKKNMTHVEVFQQRREIEVLKICQHQNIIGLIDLFENASYYFIVLEYMAGADLFDYLQARNFNVGEERVKMIAYQIACGLKYMHSYGVVHRDLKLENIMMSDQTDIAIPKIVDFGLAKMIGPQEKADEPFGTLGYVAPEILLKKPYSFQCDLWSYGCILYALLCSSLPFDHDN